MTKRAGGQIAYLRCSVEGWCCGTFGPEYDDQVASYHMAMIKEAGLIEARVMIGHGAYANGVALALKWLGHEFLDSIRKDDAWAKVKSTARSKGLDLTFDVIKTVAKYLLESAMKGGI